MIVGRFFFFRKQDHLWLNVVTLPVVPAVYVSNYTRTQFFTGAQHFKKLAFSDPPQKAENGLTIMQSTGRNKID